METLCPVTRERLSFFAGKILCTHFRYWQEFPFYLMSSVFHAGSQVCREWWASIFLELDIMFMVVLCIYFFAGGTLLRLLLSIY